MTRYEVHSMIAGMDIGEQMDLEVCKSLIEKYGSSRDIELLITDNGVDMTYGEVADQLNRYHKREEILKKSDDINDLTSSVLDLQEENAELKEVLGSILIEVKQQLSYNKIGEVKVFINPSSFDLIRDVLIKYGVSKGWY